MLRRSSASRSCLLLVPRNKTSIFGVVLGYDYVKPTCNQPLAPRLAYRVWNGPRNLAFHCTKAKAILPFTITTPPRRTLRRRIATMAAPRNSHQPLAAAAAAAAGGTGTVDTMEKRFSNLEIMKQVDACATLYPLPPLISLAWYRIWHCVCFVLFSRKTKSWLVVHR